MIGAFYPSFLIFLRFCYDPALTLHQPTIISFQNNSEKQGPADVLNLGRCLSLLDEFLKNYQDVKQFTGKEEEYKILLRLVARKRCRSDAGKDTVEEFYERLLKESERFVKIYHTRGGGIYLLEIYLTIYTECLNLLHYTWTPIL